MKFLCMSCDEGMRFKEARGPQEGSLTAIFECPGCGWQMAMFTNPMETQLVRSLDVRIGGKPVGAEPMGAIREMLDVGNGEEKAPGCPFSSVVNQAADASDQPDVVWTEAAAKRLERIPAFARPMAKRGIEQYAREHGHREITEQLMDEVKARFGM